MKSGNFLFTLRPCALYRVPFIYGQSLEGEKNEPRVSFARRQNESAASGSPSIGYKITLTGARGNLRMASLNKLSLFLLVTRLRQGFFDPMVGRPSVNKKMLSGAGFISRMALMAFNRLVPFCGTTLRILPAAWFN